MSLTERICSHLEHLPEEKQAEVLDFVEFLSAKSRQSAENAEWSEFSFGHAVSGMEDEEEFYSMDDLREVY